MKKEEVFLMNSTCGKGLKSLSTEEMENVYGASDVDPRWTPIASAAINSAARSSKICISAVGSAIGGIVSYNKNCAG
ncbi:lichenicidin A2 family type 2 lantibiotic [Priestia endophytica]|uniref:lichenicidin A2 family type 2 lantibiotic n=1 Tax=Priestia endophytica TaxID=135735 RepID=UPI001F5B4EAD|nr:mersacidin family lantibiotic [Priestia endophytica]